MTRLLPQLQQCFLFSIMELARLKSFIFPRVGGAPRNALRGLGNPSEAGGARLDLDPLYLSGSLSDSLFLWVRELKGLWGRRTEGHSLP